MSEFPPPMVASQSTNPPSRSSYFAWAIILLAVAGILIVNVYPELRGRGGDAGVSYLQMEMSAKYAVGVHALVPEPVAPLIQQIDTLAQTIDQKTRVAMLVGELEGGDAALERLAGLETGLENPMGKLDEILKPIYLRDFAALRTIYTDGPDALAPADRDRLVRRHGYFANVAFSYHQPDSDPQRQTVLQQGRREAIVLFGAVIIGVLSAVGGFVLMIIAIVLVGIGKIRMLYARPAGASAVYIEMFAVYLVLMIAFSALQWVAMTFLKLRPTLAWAWMLSIVLPLAIGWAMWRGIQWNELRAGLGWHTGRGLLIEVPLGIVGYISGLPVIIVGFVISVALMRMVHVIPSHPIVNEPTDSAWRVLQLYGLACIWAPVMEETMFRGALFHYLRGRWGWLISAGVVSLIFAAIHPQGWTFIPVLGAIAIVLAGLREWRGSIVPSMVAHAMNNFVMVSLLVLLK